MAPRCRSRVATGVRRGRASTTSQGGQPASATGKKPVEDEIYLDNNATTRPLAEVREAMLAALDAGYGNPSSD